MSNQKFTDRSHSEREMAEDMASAQAVETALLRMRSGAIIMEERSRKGKFIAIVASVIVALAVFAGHDFISTGMDGDEILLGMSFLRHLNFEQRDGVLTLTQ